MRVGLVGTVDEVEDVDAGVGVEPAGEPVVGESVNSSRDGSNGSSIVPM